MKALSLRSLLVLGILICGLSLVSANAECGSVNLPATLHRQSWQGDSLTAPLLLASDHEDDIVGMWKVNFNAKGNASVPDGVIDSAFVVWHSDKSEIMNSSRPPQTGNFCLGVWERIGHSKYKVSHFFQGTDTSSNRQVGHIAETVWLSPDGKSYTGNFTLDFYDGSGNLETEILGTITATRVTVDTPYTILFQ